MSWLSDLERDTRPSLESYFDAEEYCQQYWAVVIPGLLMIGVVILAIGLIAALMK